MPPENHTGTMSSKETAFALTYDLKTANTIYDQTFNGLEGEAKYADLIQHQIQPFFLRLAAAMDKQSTQERNQGRCAVMDFDGVGKQRISTFTTATKLRAHLAKSSSSVPPSRAQMPKYRRLFILEDLPYDYILMLGSLLHIPPSFFASHWDDPSALAFNLRNSFERCSLPSFRLHYATSYRVLVDAPTTPGVDAIYAFDSRVSRHLATYSKNGLIYDEPNTHHVLSFWSSPVQQDGSWDAVLLVDPYPGTTARCVSTGLSYPLIYDIDRKVIPKRFFFPELLAIPVLPQDCAQWSTAFARPTYVSMFDDTINAIQRQEATIQTDSPLTVVEIPRRLVIAITISYLRRRYANLVKLQNGSPLGPQTMQHTFLSGFSKSSCSTWSSEFFDFIVGHRAAMRICMRELDYDIVALGLDSPRSSAPHWEQDGWHSIKELACMLDETLKSIADGYMQYVTIQEARVSNSNAQSLSRITMLTMLFIPLSTLASIFSMSGDFLPGQDKAWVFWVVALPVLAVLLLLYCSRILGALYRRKRHQLLPLFEMKTQRNIDIVAPS